MTTYFWQRRHLFHDCLGTNPICSQYRCSQRGCRPTGGCDHRVGHRAWWQSWCSPLSYLTTGYHEQVEERPVWTLQLFPMSDLVCGEILDSKKGWRIGGRMIVVTVEGFLWARRETRQAWFEQDGWWLHRANAVLPRTRSDLQTVRSHPICRTWCQIKIARPRKRELSPWG